MFTARKEDVTIQNKRMHKYLYQANQVAPGSLMKDIQAAFRYLCLAKGFYYALNGLGLLSAGNRTGEDIIRIENKINGLMGEKLRQKGIVWKGETD